MYALLVGLSWIVSSVFLRHREMIIIERQNALAHRIEVRSGSSHRTHCTAQHSVAIERAASLVCIKWVAGWYLCVLGVAKRCCFEGSGLFFNPERHTHVFTRCTSHPHPVPYRAQTIRIVDNKNHNMTIRIDKQLAAAVAVVNQTVLSDYADLRTRLATQGNAITVLYVLTAVPPG